MAPDTVSTASDAITTLDWLLRLSNLIVAGILWQLAHKVGEYEAHQRSLVENDQRIAVLLTDLASDLKAISRVLYELVGSTKGQINMFLILASVEGFFLIS